MLRDIRATRFCVVDQTSNFSIHKLQQRQQMGYHLHWSNAPSIGNNDNNSTQMPSSLRGRRHCATSRSRVGMHHKQHTLENKNLFDLTRCSICGMLFAPPRRQGLYCRACGFTTHERCYYYHLHHRATTKRGILKHSSTTDPSTDTNSPITTGTSLYSLS